MIENTLTLENLKAIYDAMSKINEIDRSTFFNQYFKEVTIRLKEEKELALARADFKIYREGDKQIIERVVYPKFKGVISFDNQLSDVDDIEVDEDFISAEDMAKALREAGEFIMKYKPQ